MYMKFAPASPATALASRVLPQPGGPCNKNPFPERLPSFYKIKTHHES